MLDILQHDRTRCHSYGGCAGRERPLGIPVVLGPHREARLLEPRTGILISAYDVKGTAAACGSGAEGSSIWMVCHMLQIVDPAFAKEQYGLARKALGASFLGFGFAREWPRDSGSSQDIDSGPVDPLLNASPSSTALAAVAAAAFGDDEYYRGISASVALEAYP